MKVDAKLLWQAVKNVSVYSRKDGWAGAVKVDIDDSRVSLTTSDDFVGITSVIPFDSHPRGRDTFWLSHDSVKELEKYLRDLTGEVGVRVNDSGNMGRGYDRVIQFEVGDDDKCFVGPAIGCPNEEWWGMFEYVMDHVNAFPVAADSWALDPARLSKMNLLEPKAEYPLALSNCEIDGERFVAFKYGSNTFGMIKPLDVEKLREVYDRIEDVLWT
jgi:hypothetical protein